MIFSMHASIFSRPACCPAFFALGDKKAGGKAPACFFKLIEWHDVL
ncbi:hypothetical protein HMPREF3213_03397 [Heyndrickxia coagulans]|uniref:Uncharacterized protein n=1 Tax=Heyndrickxia coagulans TaxID=1398 RepID=A0A133KC95_HEYCO|nr:hypothetical protein HMPREF3213_03397 [Heyndrickxia coagulans]